MITFDYLTLKAFFEENKDFFEGARLQKIQQPTRRDFLFSIRGYETRKLYINIDPQLFHLCFISDKTYGMRNINIPQKPPMFCMLLRKYLEGSRITKIRVPDYERIFEIYIETYNELNESVELCLAVELMGKYSNIVLYNCDTKIIIGCAHNVGSEKSRERELAGTLPYIYPQKQNKSDILRYFGQINYDSLNDNFLGISKSFQVQLKKLKVDLEKIKDYMELKSITPAISGEEFSLFSELLDTPVVYSCVSDMIDAYYSFYQENIIKHSLRQKLQNIIYPKYKKQKKLTEKLLYQISKKNNAVKYKKYADLIMTNLYNNKDYIKNLEVTDWDSGQVLNIPMNKELTLKENAQKYYQMFSNSKNALEHLTELHSSALIQQDYLKGIIYSIESAELISELLEIESECEEAGFIKSNKEPKRKSSTISVETVDIDGFKVYIGKNNKQNDYIVSKIASADDIWFHVQNCTGSHILLKLSDNRVPDDKSIYECCKLAKKYSSASDSTKIGVIYTKRKYLKKPPKSHLGYVTYKNEKEIIVSD